MIGPIALMVTLSLQAVTTHGILPPREFPFSSRRFESVAACEAAKPEMQEPIARWLAELHQVFGPDYQLMQQRCGVAPSIQQDD